VGLAGAWWAHEENVSGLIEELAGGHLEELPAWERGVEVPIELIEGLQVSEARELGAAIELAMVADGDFVLEDEFEELKVTQAAGLGFLKTDIQ
jgi:hypothetical protein